MAIDAIHLHEPNAEVFEAFGKDEVWSGKPFWMLNTFAYHSGEQAANAQREYGQCMASILEDVGARVIMHAPAARTVIGPRQWVASAIVEYPSPEAFLAMATSPALAAASKFRRIAFADQFLIPIAAGWMPGFDLDKTVHARSPINQWGSADIRNTPNAFVGKHHTQASTDSAEAFVSDNDFAGNKPVWMLNLLKYASDGGKRRHDAYVAGGGNDFPGGSLGRQFGLRVVYSARRTFESLIGATDWDTVAIVSYPSRNHFLTMGGNEHYIEIHEGRKAGLSETYIIALRPER
jgi:uncharacterized protein (DUF1330 family)